MTSITGLLTGICSLGAVLCFLAAMILFAMGKLTDGTGARGEAWMIACVMAGAAFSAGAIYIAANQGVFTSMGI